MKVCSLFMILLKGAPLNLHQSSLESVPEGGLTRLTQPWHTGNLGVPRLCQPCFDSLWDRLLWETGTGPRSSVLGRAPPRLDTFCFASIIRRPYVASLMVLFPEAPL